MSKREILCTKYGEMVDMLTCMAIENGAAKEKRNKKRWNFDEAIALR